MKCVQMGAAPRPPVMPTPFLSRRGRSLSKPTQTEVQRVGVNPVNQASLKLLVVPVLPAAGKVNPNRRTTAPEP